jgi:protein AroM
MGTYLLMKVGALTIGQSPRVDIIPEIHEVLGPGVEIVERGALDELDAEEIKKLRPKVNDYMLVTRMRDGTQVEVAISSIIEKMRGCIRDLEKEGVDLILLLCTGEFPELVSRKIILRPDTLMRRTVGALLENGRLGIVVPSSEQTDLIKRWQTTNLEIVAKSVSPYTGTHQQLQEKAYKMKEENVDLIVLDCLGFTSETKRIFREITGRPVLLPRTLIARIAREMLD